MKKFALLFFIITIFNITVSAKIKIVTTIVPLANIVHSVSGDSAEVMAIIPPGVSPHTFSPTPKIIKEINNADIIVINGAGLDFWINKFLNRNARILNLSDYVPLIKGENGKGNNPHIWLSVSNVKEFAGLIDSTLCLEDPDNAGYYKLNTERFVQRLDSLDRGIKKRLSGHKNRYFISFHPSWTYFAKEYGINEVAVIEESPGKEPNPKYIMNIIKEVRKYNIHVLFAEPQLNSKAVHVIASETGIKTDFLDPIGTFGEDYVDFLKSNFLKIEESFNE